MLTFASMGKSVLSARIDEGVFKIFQDMCKADRRSQAAMLEIMIENYNPINPVKFIKTPEIVPDQSKPKDRIPVPVIERQEGKKFNLAEALAAVKES